jgi:trimeric autotransporter adhesin
MKKYLLAMFIFPVAVFAQNVGIGTQTPHASAMLDVSSNNKGLLIPRLTEVQKEAIANPATGLLVWQTDGTPGFYYNNGTPQDPKWYMLSTAMDTDWKLTGNNNVDSATHFLGSINKAPVYFKVRNTFAGQLDSGKATYFGYKAGQGATHFSNTAFGTEALAENSDEDHNTAFGLFAIRKNRTGNNLTAVGSQALSSNVTGKLNVALGSSALRNNVHGDNNVAVGFKSLLSNTTGFSNVAIGNFALENNSGGYYNTALGTAALQKSYSNFNTAIGFEVLSENEGGSFNTGVGFKALHNNVEGVQNTGLGMYALLNNSTGSRNIGVGYEAGKNNSTGTDNSFFGYLANVSTSNRTNATVIGSRALAECSNCLILGSVDGKNGATANVNVGIGTTAPAVRLQVGTNGDGTVARANAWQTFSDARFKKEIVTIDQPLEKLNQIGGYYYHWNLGTDETRQAGLIAQEVEKVLPEIVSTDDQGYKSVDYGKMNALLIEAIKELQQQVNDLKRENQEIKQSIKK